MALERISLKVRNKFAKLENFDHNLKHVSNSKEFHFTPVLGNRNHHREVAFG